MTLLVIGYGNPLRGDDGVGWRVVERLQGVEGITAVSSHQLLPEHAYLIWQVDHVLFVDATVEGQPGEIRIQPLVPETYGAASSHQMSPAVLLAYAEQIFGRFPPAHLITITGQHFGYEEQLSPLVMNKLDEVCQIVTGTENGRFPQLEII